MLSVPPATQSAGRCRRMKDVPLLPAHGDAHPGNLLPTSHGWRWIDCEDVSSMPQFWDLASFFANPALLRGFDPPLIAPASELSRDHLPPESLWWAMRTRGVMSLANNLGLVLAEQGDRVFA